MRITVAMEGMNGRITRGCAFSHTPGHRKSNILEKVLDMAARCCYNMFMLLFTLAFLTGFSFVCAVYYLTRPVREDSPRLSPLLFHGFAKLNTIPPEPDDLDKWFEWTELTVDTQDEYLERL